MRVLKRKPGEALRLGEDITGTVLSVRGNRVRVGITAPKSIPVHRWEALERNSLEPAESVQAAVSGGRVPESLEGRPFR